MSKPFKGVINVDIRDSVPDWAPFEPPKAPDGAPTSSTSCSTTWASRRSAAMAARWTRRTSTASPPRASATPSGTPRRCARRPVVPADGRNHTRNSMACITEAAIGFPNASGTIPPENGMLRRSSGARLEHLHDRQVAPVPDGRDAPGLDAAQLADRAGFERFYGFLGAETNQWHPDLVYDNHPVDQP